MEIRISHFPQKNSATRTVQAPVVAKDFCHKKSDIVTLIIIITIMIIVIIIIIVITIILTETITLRILIK
jgi:hypothetical protein